jgi:hypothetical protein
MLLDAILKLHDKIQNMKLGVDREREVTELEQERLRRLPLAADLAGLQAPGGPTLLGHGAAGSLPAPGTQLTDPLRARQEQAEPQPVPGESGTDR